MRQKCLLLFLILTLILPLKVSAEQAAAEQYRQMFKSGNFYVEYQVKLIKFDMVSFNDSNEHVPLPIFLKKYSNFAPCAIAAENGRRMERTMGKGYIGYGRGIFSPVRMNQEFVETRRKKHSIQNPEILYHNGKYYRFRQNKTAIVLPESQINSSNLNLFEEWQFIKSDLSLPDELAIFCWNDKFHYNPNNTPEPKYNGSSKRTIDNKEYDCDQYINYISSLANTNLAMEAYNMLYQNGQLTKIQKYFIRDSKETLMNEIDIKTITSQVPPTAFKIANKVKVYAAKNGDMNDLINQSVVVEELGGN